MVNPSLQQSVKGLLPVKRHLLQSKPQLTVLDPPGQVFVPTRTAPAQVSLLQVHLFGIVAQSIAGVGAGVGVGVGAGVGAGVGSGAGGHSSLGRHSMIGPYFWFAALTVLEPGSVYSLNSETTVVVKSSGSKILHKDFSSLEKQHSRNVVSYHANTTRVVLELPATWL